MNRRLLVGSIAVAAVVAVGGGWALSAAGDGDSTSTDDTAVVMDTPGVVQDPTIGTNAQVQGDPLPDVTLPDIDGNDVATSSLVGQPLVINFWAERCVPCKKEMPLLAAKSAALEGTVRFVGVNPEDDADGAREFAEEYGADYLQLLDKNGELVVPAGVGVLPVTLFVDASGTIVRQSAGELTEDELDAALAEAFGVDVAAG